MSLQIGSRVDTPAGPGKIHYMRSVQRRVTAGGRSVDDPAHVVVELDTGTRRGFRPLEIKERAE